MSAALGGSKTPAPVPDWLFAAGLPVALTGALLLAWQMAVQWSGIPAFILPTPVGVLRRAGELWPALLRDASATGSEALVSFLIAAVLGMAVSAGLAASAWLRDAFYPNLVLFQLIPKVALAPLFVLWFGLGAESRLIFAVFLSFFPVSIATLAGLAATDGGALQLCRSLGATRWQTFAAIQIPYALAYVFSGIKVAATMAFIGVVVGEFISAQVGLGHAILLASSRADTAAILANIAVLCLLGLGLYGAIAITETAVRCRWHG